MPPINHTHRLILSLATQALVDAGHLNLCDAETDFAQRAEGRYVDVVLPGEIPTLIYLSRCYRDEWTISVALWPTDDARGVMHASGADARAGEAFFFGWTNRWQFSGQAFGIESFETVSAFIHPARRSVVAAIETPATGIAERLMRVYFREQDNRTVQDSSGAGYAFA